MAPRKAVVEKKEVGVVVEGKKGRKKATTAKKDKLTSLSSLEHFLAQLGNRSRTSTHDDPLSMADEEENEHVEEALIWKRQYEELYALKETEGQRIYTEAVKTLEKEEEALKEWKISREKKYVQQVKELKKAVR